MSGYLIKYNEILISIDIKKWSRYSITILEYSDFKNIRSKHPYAEYKVYDFEEQLSGYSKKNGKKLGRFLPKEIKKMLLELPEVKLEIRNNKINTILE